MSAILPVARWASSKIPAARALKLVTRRAACWRATTSTSTRQRIPMGACSVTGIFCRAFWPGADAPTLVHPALVVLVRHHGAPADVALGDRRARLVGGRIRRLQARAASGA